MTSLIRTIRDWMHGTPKDAPLEYSQITDDLYIGAWPTKYNLDTIQSLGITLVLSTILESVDKELGQPPLRLVKMRMSDAIPKRPYYPTKTLMRGVNAAMEAFEKSPYTGDHCRRVPEIAMLLANANAMPIQSLVERSNCRPVLPIFWGLPERRCAIKWKSTDCSKSSSAAPLKKRCANRASAATT